MREEQQHFGNGVMRWLSDRFGAIEWKLGELHATSLANRQMVIDMHRTVSHRMDRMEDRISNGHSRWKWLRHVPWVKITLLSIVGLLVVTGHMTVAEIKQFIARRLLE